MLFTAIEITADFMTVNKFICPPLIVLVHPLSELQRAHSGSQFTFNIKVLYHKL